MAKRKQRRAEHKLRTNIEENKWTALQRRWMRMNNLSYSDIELMSIHKLVREDKPEWDRIAIHQRNWILAKFKKPA